MDANVIVLPYIDIFGLLQILLYIALSHSCSCEQLYKGTHMPFCVFGGILEILNILSASLKLSRYEKKQTIFKKCYSG